MKKSFLLCLLMTLFTTWALQAAELTVHDGTNTNNKAPMYVYYFDDFTRSQTVFPAEELADMKNESILSMKFYTSYTSAYTTLSDVVIYLKEVEDATISAFVNKSDATIVYQGTLDFVLEDGKATVTIEFTTPFEYNGGNLMFGCDNTTDAGYQNISFYGETVTGASISNSDASSLDNITTGVARDFLPKTTFTYGAPPSCPKATGLTFTNVTADNATFSWDAISNVSTWNFAASTEADFPDDADKTFAYNNIPASLVSGNTVDFSWIKTLTGFSLEPNTTYYVKLQANCGADGLGDWSNVASFHTACEAFALPFFDGFEENNLTNECWTSESVTGTSSWTTGAGDYSTSTGTGNGSYNALIKHGSNGNVTKLISPVIDMSSVTAAELSFMHIQRPWGNDQDVLKVYYRTSAADEWHLLQEYTEAINSWTTEENINLPNPSSTYQIAFEMTDSYGYGVAIDDVRIAPPAACPKPTGLAVSNIEAHNATFSWTGESDNGWQLCLNDGGDDTFYNISANPFSFASAPLKAETTYSVKVRTICEGDATSDWSNEVTFTTDIACPVPTFGAEAVSNLGATEATIAWDGNGEDYTLSYRKARYVDGLEETFGTSIPTDWTMFTGMFNEETGEATLTTATYGWSFGTGNSVFDNHARVNIYGNNQRWLVTPRFLCEGSDLGFDMALTAYSGDVAAPQTTGTDDKFMVLVSIDNMATWKVLRKWDNAGSEYVYNAIANSATGEHVALDLSEYIGQNIHIAFYGESTESNADNNLHIDNLLIGTVHEATAWVEKGVTEKQYTLSDLDPETKYEVKVKSDCGEDGESQDSEIISFTTIATCVTPTAFSADNVGAHDATFTWSSDAISWELNIESSEGDVTYEVTDNAIYSPVGLKPETEYIAKVRTVCGSDYSAWSDEIYFTTAVACPAPTNLDVELTPGDGKVASLLWAAGSAEDWILQYSESAAFEPAQEITVNGNSFYDLDDLTPETTYYARVKALCGDEDGDSEWSEPISFTPTNAYTLTVNDGTSTNGQVPIYGYWADHLTNSQFIIPAENLESIVYGKISELVFHASQVSASFGAATFEVYVAEVNETTISSLADWSSMEKVMAAASLSIVDNQMVVTFNDPYQYMGGNLMIGFLQTATGSYPSTYWYGKTATGASLGGYDGTASQQNFLPKMTITYTPGEAPACPKPTGLTIEYNGGTEAIVSWTSDAESWNLEYGDALININQNPYTIQNLALATTYQVRVQALCSEENASDWTNVVEFTTDLCLPEEMKTITYKLTDSYDDGWNGSAALRVVHKTTNKEVASLTLTSGDSPLEGSLDLCCGEEYSFIWKKGPYDTECGFEIYDINGNIILSKEGCNSGCESPDDGAVLLNYTMNCSSGPTGVEDVKNDAQVYKFVKDGNLFILHNGKLFNAQGKFVK